MKHRHLYLVVDPRPGAARVLPKVAAALAGGVDVVQVWNHWADGQDGVDFVERTIALARPRGVPVLVHERLDLLRKTAADGIHYDVPFLDPSEVREVVGHDVLYGVTVGNDLERVAWAVREGADYVSFSAMYPSRSVEASEIVAPPTLAAARERYPELTIYASGGITPENARDVLAAGADGVAVVSGILAAGDPEAAARRYADAIRAARSTGDGTTPTT